MGNARTRAYWRCCVSAPAMNRPGSLRLDTGAGRERPPARARLGHGGAAGTRPALPLRLAAPLVISIKLFNEARLHAVADALPGADCEPVWTAPVPASQNRQDRVRPAITRLWVHEWDEVGVGAAQHGHRPAGAPSGPASRPALSLAADISARCRSLDARRLAAVPLGGPLLMAARKQAA